jgi:hypothetical protein
MNLSLIQSQTLFCIALELMLRSTDRDEAIASYLEFTGEAKVHVVGHGLQLINNTFSLQIIVIVQFLIILGLLIMIISS